MSDQMQRIVLASRPNGAPADGNFRLETDEAPEPGPGEALVKTVAFSLDPYMRGRMDDAKSYAAPVPIGGTMEAGGVGEVVASNFDGLQPGDLVFGMTGWATHAVQPGKALRKLDPGMPLPPTVALGVLGMPGFTGWFGLTEHGRPKAGETLVVAACTGPVGSMVGQMAKSLGLRTIGIAGGAEKVRLATETFGFDTCIDHRAHDDARSLRKVLAQAAPDGVDIYFENVGGKVLEAVLPLMNDHGRIPICGMIAWYNAGNLGAGADATLTLPAVWRRILTSYLSVNGFIISNHWDRLPAFLAEVAPKVVTGQIAYLEDIVDGLENAPSAFRGLLEGKNTGKLIVRLS